MKLLQHENEIYLEILREDCLLVLAKGLGIERIFLTLVNTYNDPGNLVLVLGTTPQEQEYFIDQLKEENVSPLPKVVNSDYESQERYQVYLDAGTVFVTSRILVVDMLMDRVPIDLITGIIVYRAHKLLESCQEAFILRLYRQKNKTGFIKALSTSPVSFTRGFCQVQRIMRNLFVRKLYLWPRFHAVVHSCLEEHKPDVVELHVPMTQSMQSIQMALLDLMNECLKMIRRMNPGLDVDEMTVENAIARAFEKIVKYQLDPIWHQLGPKTKRLIDDIRTLRTLLIYLTQYDCVTFYKIVKSIRDNVCLNVHTSEWLFMDSAQTLFVCAKERVFGPEAKGKKRKVDPEDKSNAVPQFEENPKWLALSEVLAEIQEEANGSQETVLVITEDDKTSSQLKEFLQRGSQEYLQHLYNQMLSNDTAEKSKQKKPMAKGKGKSAAKNKMAKQQSSSDSDDIKTELMEVDDATASDTLPTTGSESDDQSSTSSPVTIMHAVKGRSDAFQLQRIINLMMPKYVVMYDADMATIRQLEVYQALTPDRRLRVYFLVYEDSAEEQRHLTNIRMEKEAFEFLINEKAGMVIPENRDGKTDDDHPDLERDTTPANETVSTRKAGGQERPTGPQKIIIDLREFRSELPPLIHRRGIDIEPVTLQVGDYILSNDMCVERKSISDLISSLHSSRLYNQAQAMCRYYKRPILLIEFDQRKSFSFQGNYFISREGSSSNITSRLILLTLHFPRLKIVWSPSPYVTAEIFEMLKLGKEQPDAAHARAVTAQEMDGEMITERYSAAPQDFLRKMPGVNSKNIYAIMNRVECLADLVTLSLDQITEILGNSMDAKLLWEAIHERPKKDAQKQVPGNSSSKGAVSKNRKNR